MLCNSSPPSSISQLLHITKSLELSPLFRAKWLLRYINIYRRQRSGAIILSVLGRLHEVASGNLLGALSCGARTGQTLRQQQRIRNNPNRDLIQQSFRELAMVVTSYVIRWPVS